MDDQHPQLSREGPQPLSRDLQTRVDELEDARDRLEAMVESRTAMLELLSRTADAASAAASVEEALAEILPAVTTYLGAGCAQAWLLELGAQASLVPLGPLFAGDADDVAVTWLRARKVGSSQLAQAVLASGETRWTSDLSAAAVDEPCIELAHRAGLTSAMALPILVGNETTGVVELLLEVSAERLQGASELATIVGAEIGRVVERVGLHRKISDLTADEQRRLGQELHDSVGQQLTAVRLLAERLERRLADGSTERSIAAEIVAAASQAQEQVRSLARGLVPVAIAAGGLRHALENLAERIRMQRGVLCTVHERDEVIVDDEEVATNLYYIAQEAVTNAIQHGQAQQVTVTLEVVDRSLRLDVSDDGCGFLPQDRANDLGSGLRIMAFRARLVGGRIEITSEPGHGATISCVITRGWQRR
jgi:signal transduction histidine kinase